MKVLGVRILEITKTKVGVSFTRRILKGVKERRTAKKKGEVLMC